MTLVERPRFISLIGYPAAGKSTYAKQLRDEGFTVISGDEVIREAMVRYNLPSMDAAFREHRDEINQTMTRLIDEAFERGDNIALDAFNTTRRRRQTDLNRAKESRYNYRCEAVIIHPPEEEEHTKRLVQRIIFQREYATADGLFLDKLEKSYEPPTAEEGFDSITEVGVPPKKPLMHM